MARPVTSSRLSQHREPIINTNALPILKLHIFLVALILNPVKLLTAPILNIVQKPAKLPRTKNYCPDGILFIFLKNYAQTLATPIAQLLWHLIFTGIIPERWKYAIVLPLYKNRGNETSVIITDH